MFVNILNYFFKNVNGTMNHELGVIDIFQFYKVSIKYKVNNHTTSTKANYLPVRGLAPGLRVGDDPRAGRHHLRLHGLQPPLLRPGGARRVPADRAHPRHAAGRLLPQRGHHLQQRPLRPEAPLQEPRGGQGGARVRRR